MTRRRIHGALWTLHKYAGLAAGLWLTVLAVTGVLLGHHEWRWLNQNTVPPEWTSPQIGRLVPATVMRHIAASEGVIVGASERGAWRSTDAGASWQPVRFTGLTGTPQVTGFAELGRREFKGLFFATDDGVWAATADGARASRVAMEGEHVTAISPDASDSALLVVVDRTDVFSLDPRSGRTARLAIGEEVVGAEVAMPLDRVVMDIHFGRGLLAGSGSIWLNDFAGIALTVLALTGTGYWWVTRRGRRRGFTLAAQRGTIRWLFRLHGPFVGLAAAVPILILAVTAIPLNHIYGFINVARDYEVRPGVLPPAYRAKSLSHEIDGIASWPDDPRRLTIATRFGLLESRNGGRSWAVDGRVPVAFGTRSANLFRVGDRVFAGYGDGDNFFRTAAMPGWRRVEGTRTAITSATFDGSRWLVKNSKAIHGEATPGVFVATPINFRSAVTGTPLFLFLADVHSGAVIHTEFKWVNDAVALAAILLALSGPVVWLRRRWI
jgi:hypothetical protein